MSTTKRPTGNFDIRPIDRAESEAFRYAMAVPFGFDPLKDDKEAFRELFEFDRSVCAFDGDQIVGTCMAFSFDLTVPGSRTVPMGGTTVITVQPTHTRQGALRSMMTAHLDEIQRHGDPIAGLWASESSIYGRFGYGIAAESHEVAMDGSTVRFTEAAPNRCVRFIDSDEAATVLPAIFDRVRRTRPGMFNRSDTWWRYRLLRDPEHRREGMTALRFLVSRNGDKVDGYAMCRQKEAWGEFPIGKLSIKEVITETPEAHDALWRCLLSFDLFPKVTCWNLPVDDELPRRLADPRRVVRKPSDSMWIRLLDIPAALDGRGYGCEEHIAIGVEDPFLPANNGVYILKTSPSGASCTRSDSTTADITLPIDVLSAIYLGGSDLHAYHRAGRVAAPDLDTIRRLDLLFRSTGDRAPWCHEVF